MNTGLLATICVFVLAVVFGLILRADVKKTSKTGKTAAATPRPTAPPSAIEAKSQPDSWQKSAERFRRRES